MTKHRTRLLVVACVLACADGPASPDHTQLITAAEAYSPRIGERWTFVNGYGDTTTIVTQAAPNPVACRGGANVVWRYEKSNARAYWLPGVPEATIDFVLHQDPDSSWRSTASVISFPQSCPWCNGATKYTWDVLDNAAPTPNGYRITPPSIRVGEHLSFESYIDSKGGEGIHTLGCVVPDGQLIALPGHGLQWRTEFYIETVSTPLYSGPASVSEQWENCNVTHTNPGCGHEKWWFAPGYGLVKVHQINSGSGVDGDLDPRIIMVRVK
jgi:hypothetical protein